MSSAEKMIKISSHQILAQAESPSACRDAVLRYFRTTNLVRYDHVELIDDQQMGADNSEFPATLDRAISKNHQTVKKLLKDLQAAGVQELDDLKNLKQGYPSKTLHILTHFLDGFIGIDSAFYNLIEDSHWVSEELKKQISETPGHYFLFTVEGFSCTPKQAALLHM